MASMSNSSGTLEHELKTRLQPAVAVAVRTVLDDRSWRKRLWRALQQAWRSVTR